MRCMFCGKERVGVVRDNIKTCSDCGLRTVVEAVGYRNANGWMDLGAADFVFSYSRDGSKWSETPVGNMMVVDV